MKISPENKRLFSALKNRSARMCLGLHINENRKPGIADSKLGGRPYWNAALPYPTDANGRPMALLAQIRLTADTLKPLPDHGLLQFYMTTDAASLYGVERDADGRQSNVCVVWHEEIDNGAAVADHPVQANHDNLPVRGEYALDVRREKSFISTEHHNFGSFFSEAAKDIVGKSVEPDDWCEYLGGDLADALRETLAGPSPRHRMLGHPTMAQGDPLRKERFRRYDTLLLQVDSDTGKDGDRVMWGDMGTGAFYINGEDLKQRRFTDILYVVECG